MYGFHPYANNIAVNRYLSNDGPYFKSGDFETNNADRTGGRSIFGEKYFDDENFVLKHDSRGVLSMDNYGWPDTVSSRFFVTFDEAPW